MWNAGTRRWKGLTAVCLVAGLALTPRPASSAGSDSLFPTGKGSAWTFKGTAGPQALEMTAAIASASSAGGKTTVNMQWQMGGRNIQDETYIVTATEVQRSRSGAGGANVITPPITILKMPAKVGTAWTWKGELTTKTPQGEMKFNGTAKLKIAARETVKTTGGTFNAFRVDMDLTISAQGQTQTIPNSYWFAPGAGLVKQKITIPGPGGQSVIVQAAATKVSVK